MFGQQNHACSEVASLQPSPNLCAYPVSRARQPGRSTTSRLTIPSGMRPAHDREHGAHIRRAASREELIEPRVSPTRPMPLWTVFSAQPAGPPAREAVLDEELAGEREDEGQDRHRDRASDSVGGNHHRHVVGAARREVHVVVADAVPWAMSTVIGFYVLSRAMAALQLMAHEPLVGSASAAHRFIRAFVDALSSMLPELDRFTESEWLIHSAGTLADPAIERAVQSGRSRRRDACCSCSDCRKTICFAAEVACSTGIQQKCTKELLPCSRSWDVARPVT